MDAAADAAAEDRPRTATNDERARLIRDNDDIRHTLQIAAVYLRGVEIDRAALRARVDGRIGGAAVSRFGDATYALTATKILGEVVPRRNEPLHTWEAFYWTPR